MQWGKMEEDSVRTWKLKLLCRFAVNAIKK